MTLRDSEIQNDIDSGIAENRFDAYWANPEFARTALGIFWNNVSTADDSELGKSRLQVRGTDVTCANDSNVFGSWFKHFAIDGVMSQLSTFAAPCFNVLPSHVLC